MQIMIDADLVLDYLLYKPEAEELMNIIEEGQIQFFITDIGLENIRGIANKMDHPEFTEKFFERLLTKVSVCSVDADLIEKANLLNLKDSNSAFEVACACSNKIGAVVTRNHENFSGVEFNVLSTAQIRIRQYLESLMISTKLVALSNSEPWEIQGLNLNIPPIVVVRNVSELQHLEWFMQNNKVLGGVIDMEDPKNSKLKKRILNALQAGAIEAVRSMVDHPLITIPLATAKAFMKDE